MGALVAVAVAVLGVALAACDDAGVGQCGTEGRVVAGFCVYSAEAARRSDGPFRCPAGVPVTIAIVEGGFVCAPAESDAGGSLPDEVCAALPDGCTPVTPGSADAGPVADGGGRREGGLPPPGEWSRVEVSGTPPLPRGPSLWAFDAPRDRFVLVGGFDGASALHDAWAFSPADGRWRVIRAPSSIGGVVSAVADPAHERVILLRTGSPREMLDLTTDTFTSIDDMGRGVAGLADPLRASSADAAWFFGGHREPDGPYLDTFWRLGLEPGGTWTMIEAAGPSARDGGLLVSLGSSLYLFGGHDQMFTLSDLWRFDTSAGTWTEIEGVGGTPLADAHVAGALDERCSTLWLAGGDSNNGISQVDVRALYLEREPLTVMGPPLLERRAGAGLAIDPNARRAYLFGGFDGSQAKNDVFVLDLGSGCP